MSFFVVLAWVGWYYFCQTTTPQLAPETRILTAQPEIVAVDPALAGKERTVSRAVWWWLLAVFLLTLTCVLVTLQLAGFHVLGSFSATSGAYAQHIGVAFEEERLDPPAALPPDVFINQIRPSVVSADRDWAKLDGDFRQAVLVLMKNMEARGYPLALLEGYRSPERQDKLANQEQLVTNARAFQSKHQFGFAADLAPMRGGRIVISERDPWAMAAYTALGEEAQKLGLVWGGGWSFKDYGHIEANVSLASLRRRFGT
ncbi:M15 family metallopeptidase [Chitinibacteraceae bacterium HSL-7]